MLMLLENNMYIVLRVSQCGALHALREGTAALLCDWGASEYDTAKMNAYMVKASKMKSSTIVHKENRQVASGFLRSPACTNSS